MNLESIIWPLIGYLFGSLSAAILISKLFRLTDPRQVGSGNPGATNVLRSGNKLAAALTLLGDLAKGLIPVLLASNFSDGNVGIIAATGIAAFLGHLYPIFFKFKGGKGVATAIGVFLGFSYKLVLVFVLVWVVVAATTRYSSLAALLASAASMFFSFALFTDPSQFSYIGAVFFIVAFLYLRHNENVARLKNGTESKIGQK
jgi:glycerol-3-phosphate acyltransferase PlsY